MKPKHKKLSIIKQYQQNLHEKQSDDRWLRMSRISDKVADDITSNNQVRVPRLKASRAAWKKFYEMFPWLRGASILQKKFMRWERGSQPFEWNCSETFQHLKLKQLD